MTDILGGITHDALPGEPTHFPRRRPPLPPAPERMAREQTEQGAVLPPAAASPLLILDTIRRRFASLFVATVIVASGGGALALQMRLHYVATASVMIAEQKSLLTALPAMASMLGTESVAARTQVDLLRGEDLATSVAAALDLAHQPEFARVINRPPSPLNRVVARFVAALPRALAPDEPWFSAADSAHDATRDVQRAATLLRDHISIMNDGRSYVIDIQVRTERAELSAAIANALVEAYLTLKTRIKSDALRRATARFDARLDTLAERAAAAAHAVEEYRARNGLVEDRGAAAGVTVAGQQLAQLNAQLVAVSNERARLDATLSQIRDAKLHSDSTANLPDVLDSALIQRLQEQEAELTGRVANLATTHGPADPDMMSLRAARQAIGQKINVEINRVVASLRAAAAAARTREATLREQLAGLQSQVAGEGKSSVRLAELQNAADAARSVYTEVLNRSAETANAIDLQEPDAVLVAPAIAPLTPAFPTHTQLLLIDATLAPMLGLSIALLCDRLRPGLRSADAVEQAIGLPCLGFVPRRRGRRGARDFADAVAALPATLGHKRPRVLLLTAALPGEGTSVLAEALARAMAEAGVRVLLVICGRGFAPPAAPMPNLEIITATPPALPQAPRTRYDIILLDTPAVLVATLTLPLAAIADATILIIRFGRTPPPIVARAAQTLHRYGGHLIGAVVTCVDRRQLSARDGSDLYLERHRRAARGAGGIAKPPTLPRGGAA